MAISNSLQLRVGVGEGVLVIVGVGVMVIVGVRVGVGVELGIMTLKLTSQARFTALLLSSISEAFGFCNDRLFCRLRTYEKATIAPINRNITDIATTLPNFEVKNFLYFSICIFI